MTASTSTAVSVTKTPTIPDDKLLDQLAKLWSSRHQKDLETRHQTGLILNKRLGSPEERLPYGGGFIGDASKLLGLTKGELSRMRWFAQHFETLVDFQTEHPDIKTWAGIKELLPTLNPKKDSSGKVRETDPAEAAFRKADRHLEQVLKIFMDINKPKGASRHSLISGVDRLMKVAASKLKLRYTLEEEDED